MVHHLLKPFLRGALAEERNCRRKVSRIHLFRFFREREKERRPDPPQDHPAHNKINQQKLGRELSWNVQPALESDHPIAEQKMSHAVSDRRQPSGCRDGLSLVPTGCTHSGRYHNSCLIVQAVGISNSPACRTQSSSLARLSSTSLSRASIALGRRSD